MSQKADKSCDALVIGAGPAGLMAADILSANGHHVIIADAMPSAARKFLMAGKSGLNITKNEPLDRFLSVFDPLPKTLESALKKFAPQDVIAWAEGLGQSLFTGSSGRVFPKSMKASPLLRAWLHRLNGQGVDLLTRWSVSSLGRTSEFQTPNGPQSIHAKVIVLAMGGASWARLGSNGTWNSLLDSAVQLAPFAPANAGLTVEWSTHMERHFGAPIKNTRLSSGRFDSRGEFIVSARGLEGSGIYAVSRGVREGHVLSVDLLPDWDEAKIKKTLIQRKKKETLTNFLRRGFSLPPQKIALLMEFWHRENTPLEQALKQLEISNATLRPMDEVISTAGGIGFDALSEGFEINEMSGVFAAGEMLDWEAPTGGYLITACLATGRAAGQGASAFLQALPNE